MFLYIKKEEGGKGEIGGGSEWRGILERCIIDVF